MEALLSAERGLWASSPDPHAALFICVQLLDALRYAHERTDLGGALLGIVHRDLRPSNITIGYGGEIRLGGFGFAKISGRNALPKPGLDRPRYSYVSPEQALDSDTDHRADLFCVGLLAYELLSGQPAYRFEDDLAARAGAQRGTITPLEEVAPGVSLIGSQRCPDRAVL